MVFFVITFKIVCGIVGPFLLLLALSAEDWLGNHASTNACCSYNSMNQIPISECYLPKFNIQPHYHWLIVYIHKFR
jgi:hypothetical protein